MSTAREELIARARSGDPEALELLLRAVPRELPPAVRRSVRDDRIRVLGLWLASELPGSSRHHIASLLVAAGKRYGAPAGLDVLTAAERARVVRDVRDLARWARSRGIARCFAC